MYTNDTQQFIKHCCLSESISSKKLQPVVFLFVFSSVSWRCESTDWEQLQFNKPYGCWITLTSKYYKCPELDSCFHDSSKYQPRIIGSVWHFVCSRKFHLLLLTLHCHCKPGRVMTCWADGGRGTNDHIVTPSLRRLREQLNLWDHPTSALPFLSRWEPAGRGKIKTTIEICQIRTFPALLTHAALLSLEFSSLSQILSHSVRILGHVDMCQVLVCVMATTLTTKTLKG